MQRQLSKTYKSQLSGQCAKRRIDSERDEKFRRLNEIREKNIAKIKLIQKNAQALANANATFSAYNIKERPIRQIKPTEKEYKATCNDTDINSKIEEKLEYFSNRFQKSEEIVKQINESKARIASMDHTKIGNIKAKIMNEYITMMEDKISRLQKKYKKLRKAIML